ncbi:unnamed protein product [Alopecurus aequalis]
MDAREAPRDRLRELPDETPINILERLDTLDALRTCFISKRLLRLPAMLSRFDIHICSLTSRHNTTSHGFNTDHIAWYNNVAASVTEKVLCAKSLDTSIIQELSVTCYLRPDKCLPITRAFAGIMATHKVVKAEFVPIVEKPLSECTPGDLVCYAKRFNTCLGDCSAAFAGLTHLWLDTMRFGGMDIPSILTHLSTLRLAKTGNSSTMNLELSRLLANAPTIRDLYLDFTSEKIWVVPESPKLLAHVLSKLAIVNLDNLPEGCDIGWTMFILEAAPTLRELCITVWDHLCNMVRDQDARRKHGFCEKTNVKWQPSASGFKHKNLVKLIIHGLQQDENMVRYVRRVMEVAVNMGAICLHDRKVYGCCGDLDPKFKVCPSSYPTTSEEKDMMLVEMTNGFGLTASPDVIHFKS